MSSASSLFPPRTRREFLRQSGGGIGLLAFSHFAPAFLVGTARAGAPPPEKDRRILVLVQLAGGNDGLNTVVPHTDDRYHRLRPNLGLISREILPLNDDLGLHPACSELHALFNDGKLSVVQNVGYPNPNRSHFRSTEIWETASDANETLPTGWLGRFLDNTCAGSPELDASRDPGAVHVTTELPQSFLAADEHAVFGLPARNRPTRGARPGASAAEVLELFASPPTDDAHDHDHEDANHAFLRQTTMNALVTERRVQRILAADRPETKYPGSPFAQSLHQVAAMIAAGFSTRVYFVSLGGFDTHANQAGTHQNLLQTLSAGLAAFQSDLTARGLADQVLTATFSEFGRRPAENQSKGTDHGTAAPLFVLGAQVQAGIVGDAPNLDLSGPRADLNFSTDFRSVYATLLDRWLQTDADRVLGETHARLGFI